VVAKTTYRLGIAKAMVHIQNGLDGIRKSSVSSRQLKRIEKK